VSDFRYSPTRFACPEGRLYYFRMPGVGWSFAWKDTDMGDADPKRVGPIYPTKAEMLADLTRYAKEWGFDA